MNSTIEDFNQKLSTENVLNKNQYEKDILQHYFSILNGLCKSYYEYKIHFPSVLSILESNDIRSVFYSTRVFLELFNQIMSTNDYTIFDTSLLFEEPTSFTLKKYVSAFELSSHIFKNPRISENNFITDTFNMQEKIEIISFIIDKMQNDSQTITWTNDLVISNLINLNPLRVLLNELKNPSLFYFSVGNFIDRLVTSEFFQSSRDIAEELIIASFNDNLPEYGFFNSFRAYSNQNNIHAAFVYANLCMTAMLLKGHPFVDELIKEIIKQSIKFFRNIKLPKFAIDIYDRIPKELTFNEYDRRSIDHSYFTTLLFIYDEKLPSLLLEYLNKNREAIIKGGVSDCTPWLITLYNVRRVFEDADFSISGFGGYMKIFEYIVPKDAIEKHKNIIEGDSKDLKDYLKESLIKLNETRNTADLVYDNNMALITANRLIKYSFKNKDFEAILLAMMIKADYSLIYNCKDSNEISAFTLPNLNIINYEHRYGDKNFLIEKFSNNSYNFTLWLVETEKMVFQFSIFSDEFNYSELTNWSSTEYKEILGDDYFSKIVFSDTEKCFGGVHDVLPEVYLQQEKDIASRLHFSKIDMKSNSTSVFIVKDMKLSEFPHNLFLNNQGMFIYLDNPVANILSTEWFIDKCFNSFLSKNYTKSIWIPVETGDLIINMIWKKLEKYLISHSFEINKNLEIKNQLNSDINIIVSHGKKSISQVQVIFADCNPIFNLNKIIGTGKILIFFVCYSGSMTNDFFSNSINSLVKEFISLGYEAVIAPVWALHIEIPPIWLPVFLESINCGDNLNVAVHKANLKVRDKYPTPAAWACLHLFGNPNLKINNQD